MMGSETAVGDILKSYIRKNRRILYGIRVCEALDLWSEVNDGFTNSHTQPLGIKERVMYVRTDSAPLANELAMRERELVQTINKRLDTCLIDRISFKSGRIERKRSERKKEKPVRKITASEAKKIDDVVASLQDEGLRDVFRRFLRSVARRPGDRS